MGREAQKERSDSVKNLILQTTLEIIKEKGMEAVSIRNIANRMGYTPGVIYYHFKNKQDIMDSIHQLANKDIVHIIKNSSGEDRGTIANIESVFYEVMKLAVKDKDLFELIMIDKYSARNESINPWLTMLEEALQQGVDKGDIKAINTKQVAFCIWSAYTGFFYMLGKSDDISFDQTEDTFHTLTQMIAKGIEGYKKEEK